MNWLHLNDQIKGIYPSSKRRRKKFDVIRSGRSVQHRKMVNLIVEERSEVLTIWEPDYYLGDWIS